MPRAKECLAARRPKSQQSIPWASIERAEQRGTRAARSIDTSARIRAKPPEPCLRKTDECAPRSHRMPEPPTRVTAELPEWMPRPDFAPT